MTVKRVSFAMGVIKHFIHRDWRKSAMRSVMSYLMIQQTGSDMTATMWMVTTQQQMEISKIGSWMPN